MLASGRLSRHSTERAHAHATVGLCSMYVYVGVCLCIFFITKLDTSAQSGHVILILPREDP